MEINDRIRELIAVGASVTSNCQPCLNTHVEKAISFGAEPKEVAEAIEIGNGVRKCAAAKMDAFSRRLQSDDAPGFDVVTECKGFHYLGP